MKRSLGFWMGGVFATLTVAYFVFDWPKNIVQDFQAARENNELLPRIGRDFPMMGEGSSNEEILQVRLARSSAVAFTRMEAREGGGGRVIEEIFHLVGGLECHYIAGDLIDEIETGDWRRSPTRAVHFFRGNPATPSQSMTIHGGYLLKQKDLSETRLRDSIKKLIAEGRHASTLKESPMHQLTNSSLDEALQKSSHVVVCDTEIKEGFVHYYVREVFKVSENSVHTPWIGQEVGQKRKITPNESSQESAAMAFYDLERGYPFTTCSIRRGRLLSFGEMRIEDALEKVREAARPFEKSDPMGD